MSRKVSSKVKSSPATSEAKLQSTRLPAETPEPVATTATPKSGPRRRRQPKAAAFTLAHPNAAGIDIGGAQHVVAVAAVAADRDPQPVRQLRWRLRQSNKQEFTSFTDDLEKMADWLSACGIDTGAPGGKHGRHLDPCLRMARTSGVHGLSRRRTARQERVGPQE